MNGLMQDTALSEADHCSDGNGKAYHNCNVGKASKGLCRWSPLQKKKKLDLNFATINLRRNLETTLRPCTPTKSR